MNWFSKKWKIPSAFGNEPPQKGLRFDELPRVRELRQKYAQSSDEEVLDGFKNARIIDSVLRFFCIQKPGNEESQINWHRKNMERTLNLKRMK